MKYVLGILVIMAASLFVYLGLNREEDQMERSSRAEEPAPRLSNLEIKAIIDEQRLSRTDLPEPFPDQDWVARKQEDHYVYIEYGLPKAPGYNQIFKLDRRGRIVDVTFMEDPSKSIDCPDKVFSEEELATIVAEERAKRDDLPPPFPTFRSRVDRMRCLYLYYEYALPEVPGNHHVFVIDPYGDLMEVFRAKPYQQ